MDACNVYLWTDGGNLWYTKNFHFRNCLVNSSRIVKLADFGMTRPMYENDYYRFNKKGKNRKSFAFINPGGGGLITRS